ncbi:MAG: T9SS type A sorting domain-containing protein [Phycisphaerae bacterium]|nr:T9SS type A sorting domain-containing protein [Saprospiraceae bacterium]
MRLIHTLIFILTGFLPANAQYSAILQVVGAAGLESALPGISVQSTVGEVATLTLSNNLQACTQGFHQDNRVLISVSAIEPITLAGLSVFPNPAETVVTLKSETPFIPGTQVELFDASGKYLQTVSLETGSVERRIDLTMLPTGSYLLHIRNPVGMAGFQLIKM